VRGDEPELASYLRIEERELEVGGLELAPGGDVALPPERRSEANEIAIRVGVPSFALTPVEVLGTGYLDASLAPFVREMIGVIHVHVDRSAAQALRIDASSREMDRQLVPMGERVPLVMIGGAEAQLLVVRNCLRDIRDDEDRLDTDDALHSEIIGVVAYLNAARSLARLG
jgi:hypothetical protein